MAPKNDDEYLRPQFKGQLAVNRGVPYPLSGMVSLRGEEQGIAYFKRLSQQDLRLVEGYTHNVNMMAAGEYPLTIFMQVSKLDAMKRKEAPVDWVAGTPTLATISTVAMIKNPLHPAAAQLLIDFYLSLEGHVRLRRRGDRSVAVLSSECAKSISRMESGNFHVIATRGRLRPVHENLQRLSRDPLRLARLSRLPNDSGIKRRTRDGTRRNQWSQLLKQ